MAIRTPTVTRLNPYVVHVLWTGLLNGDSGAEVDYPEYVDGTVQFTGTFGVGGSIQVEGSNDITGPTNWSLLTNPQGTTSAKTAAGIVTYEESPFWKRVNVTAGDGATSLTAKLTLRRNP